MNTCKPIQALEKIALVVYYLSSTFQRIFMKKMQITEMNWNSKIAILTWIIIQRLQRLNVRIRMECLFRIVPSFQLRKTAKLPILIKWGQLMVVTPLDISRQQILRKTEFEWKQMLRQFRRK